MNLEAQRLPETPGFLKSCLVEGDPAQERRARKVKRRALALSILFQFAFLAALVLYPLLGKGERISLKDMTPVPPYAPFHGDRHQNINHRQRPILQACSFCVPHHYDHAIITHDPTPANNTVDETVDDSELSRYGDSNGKPNGLFGSTSDRGPVKPNTEEVKPAVVRRKISEPLLAASLIRRVDPVYPALARQIRLEGRVELHAIISTDGRIQSLEVISGHPLLIKSALQAVYEWRYRPTILNGQAVEVDTHITVIYSLNTQ